LWLTLAGAVVFPLGLRAQTIERSANGLAIEIKPPTIGADGKLVLKMPKDRMLKELDRAIPASAPIEAQKLGDLLIYRDVKLDEIKASELKPSSLTLEDDVFRISGSPVVSGKITGLYEHVVVTTEVKTIAKIFGREIKQAVPVVKSDWRHKDLAAFSIKVDLNGNARVAFSKGTALADQRIRIATSADRVRIADIDLKTDELIVKVAREVIGTIGKAFPNEAFNKPIKDSLARTIEIDPFRDMPAKELQKLKRYDVKDVQVKTANDEVTATAVLTLHQARSGERL
jgi:hypothetical protein